MKRMRFRHEVHFAVQWAQPEKKSGVKPSIVPLRRTSKQDDPQWQAEIGRRLDSCLQGNGHQAQDLLALPHRLAVEASKRHNKYSVADAALLYDQVRADSRYGAIRISTD
jgi:hypothetical protein